MSLKVSMDNGQSTCFAWSHENRFQKKSQGCFSWLNLNVCSFCAFIFLSPTHIVAFFKSKHNDRKILHYCKVCVCPRAINQGDPLQQLVFQPKLTPPPSIHKKHILAKLAMCQINIGFVESVFDGLATIWVKLIHFVKAYTSNQNFAHHDLFNRKNATYTISLEPGYSESLQTFPTVD